MKEAHITSRFAGDVSFVLGELAAHTKHSDGCANGAGDAPCTCGLADALMRALGIASDLAPYVLQPLEPSLDDPPVTVTQTIDYGRELPKEPPQIIPAATLEKLSALRAKTDVETIRAMLERVGIDYSEHPCEADSQEPTAHSSRSGATNIEIHDGYDGFVSVLSFDKDGALERVAAWE